MLSLFGTLLAWVIAGTHLGSALHFAVVSHEICAEHGELVHVAGHPADHHTTSRAAQASVSATASEDAHEHCQLLARPEEQALLQRPLLVDVSAAESCSSVSVSAGDALVVPRSLRLLSAPKTSPPV